MIILICIYFLAIRESVKWLLFGGVYDAKAEGVRRGVTTIGDLCHLTSQFAYSHTVSAGTS